MKRINSLSMLIVLILLTVSSILVESPMGAATAVAFTLLFISLTGAGMRRSFGPVFSIWPFLLFIFILNALFGRNLGSGSEPIFSWWIFSCTEEGILEGLSVIFRCILVSALASAYIAVSDPLVMTESFSRLLSPLGSLGIPVERFSFIMSMSLFFIPELKAEAERIMKAQKARGASYGGNGLREKAMSYVPMIIPLFVSSLRRADEMSRALVSRGWNGERRPRRKPLTWHLSDFAAIAASAAMIFIIKGV